MKFDIISLFPQFFDSPLKESLLKKALEKQIIEINTTNLRDFSDLAHKQVDDTPYGGGAGMVLRADILTKALNSVKQKDSFVILPDPGGLKFSQNLAKKLSAKSHLIFVCGKYEGVDQRFRDKYVDLEISLGDYVLNGGEAASLVMIETIARLVPLFVGNKESLESESFAQNGPSKLLEYPQYTRPQTFEGAAVPQVLLSGNHLEIKKWRLDQSFQKTKKLRPELLKDES